MSRQGTLDSVAGAKTRARDTLAHVDPSPIRTRLLKTVVGFGVLLIVTCVIAPLVGSSPISLARVFDRSIPFSENVDAQIFFIARMPRIVAGALVGAALAAAGVVFQALLRNALATPFTLGVSAGASLGAMLAIVLGATISAGPFSAVPLASLAGAAIAAAVVYRLATMQDRAMSTTVLLLAGVTLNSFFSALIMFVQYIADFAQVYRAMRWIMGDLDVGSFDPVLAALPMLFWIEPLHCCTYWDGAYGSNAAKLTTVLPSTGWPKSNVVMDGVKFSLWLVSGKTSGTLCTWLHQVFISTGV